MKKFFIITGLVLLLTAGFVYAKSNKNAMPVIKFDKAKYTLAYSAKSDETGGYLNEYYKANQTYASWNELIGVHHYPRAYYPIEHAEEFAEYLNSNDVMANLETNEQENSALLYFVVTDRSKLPIIMEFNVFKYEKSPVCGTVGLQYAKRYRLNSTLEIEKIKKEIVKSGLYYIKMLSKTSIPDIVTLDIDKGKYVLREAQNNDMENLD